MQFTFVPSIVQLFSCNDDSYLFGAAGVSSLKQIQTPFLIR